MHIFVIVLFMCLQDEYLHSITKFIKHLQVIPGLSEVLTCCELLHLLTEGTTCQNLTN